MTAFATSTLRPLGMGQLMDRGIRLYRQNFLTFVGIVAIPQIPASLLQVVLNWFNLTNLEANLQPGLPEIGSILTQSIGFNAVVTIINLAFTQVAIAAMTQAVSDTYAGMPISIIGSYRRIGSAWVSLIKATLLAVLVMFGLAFWWIVPCVGWFTGFGILFYFMLVILPLMAPVIVLEQKRAREAIGRAWELARRRFWWLLGLTLLLAAFAQLVVTGPALLLTFLLQTAIGASFDDLTTSVISQITTLIFSLVFSPMQLACYTLMYFDLRVRTEGLDLMLQTADSAQQPHLLKNTIRDGEPARVLPNNTEMGNFAIITLAFIGLYVGLVFLLLVAGISAGLAGL